VGVDRIARWVLDRGQGVRGSGGRVDCVDGVLIDISPRQAAIAESARLAAIVESTSDFVGTAFPDGRLSYINRAGRRLLGWSDDEDVASRGITDIHPLWALGVVEGDGIPTALRRGIWAGETALLRADGQEVPVFQIIMAHRSTTGAAEYLSTTMHDLSERVAVEETLRESEERFRLLAAAAFEGIAITAEGRIVDANEQLASMLGLERAGLIGREVLDFVAPESRETVLDHLRRGSEEPYEHLARRADGSVFPIEIHARTIPFGGASQRVTVLRDLTVRKRA
jgi:PAS domain S-box-containing protein